MDPTRVLDRQVGLSAAYDDIVAGDTIDKVLSRVRLFPPLAGEVGAINLKYPWGHAFRYGALPGAAGLTPALMRQRLQNAIESAAAMQTPAGERVRHVLVPETNDMYEIDYPLFMRSRVQFCGMQGRPILFNNVPFAVTGNDLQSAIFHFGNWIGMFADDGAGTPATFDEVETIASGDDVLALKAGYVNPYVVGDYILLRSAEFETHANLTVPLRIRFARITDFNPVSRQIFLDRPLPLPRSLTGALVTIAGGPRATGLDPYGNTGEFIIGAKLHNLHIKAENHPWRVNATVQSEFSDLKVEARTALVANTMQECRVSGIRAHCYGRSVLELALNSWATTVRDVQVVFDDRYQEFAKGLTLGEASEDMLFENLRMDATNVTGGGLPMLQVSNARNCTVRDFLMIGGPAYGATAVQIFSGTQRANDNGMNGAVNVLLENIVCTGNMGRAMIVADNTGTGLPLLKDITIRGFVSDISTVYSAKDAIRIEPGIQQAGIRFIDATIKNGENFFMPSDAVDGLVVDGLNLDGGGRIITGSSNPATQNAEPLLNALFSSVRHSNLLAFKRLRIAERLAAYDPAVAETVVARTIDITGNLHIGDVFKIRGAGNIEGTLGSRTVSVVLVYGAEATELVLLSLTDTGTPDQFAFELDVAHTAVDQVSWKWSTRVGGTRADGANSVGGLAVLHEQPARLEYRYTVDAAAAADPNCLIATLLLECDPRRLGVTN